MAGGERAAAARRFEGAFLVSVCLHLLILGAFAHQAAALPAATHLPRSFQVSLRTAPPPVVAMVVPATTTARALPATTPARSRAGSGRPVRSASPGSVERLSPFPSLDEPFPPAPAPVALAAAAVAAPVAEPAPPDPAALAGYGRAIAAELSRQRQYPPVARLRGWEGTATLRLHLGVDGRLRQAVVASSSGRDVLDRQALAMAEQLAAWPPRPAALATGDLTVVVPVVFRLE